MIKIVKGNDVKLQFPFYERLEDGCLTPLNVSEITDIKVKFIRSNGDEIDVESGVSFNKNNVIVVVPCYMENGKYHVSISGMLGNAHVCSVLKECFSIVQFNSDGNYTDSRTTADTIIDASIFIRVDVEEHEVPTTEDNENNGGGDDSTNTNTDDNSTTDGEEENTETPTDNNTTEE